MMVIYASKPSRMSSRLIKIDDEGGDNADDVDNHDDGDDKNANLCIKPSDMSRRRIKIGL